MKKPDAYLERIRSVLTDTEVRSVATITEGLVNDVLIVNDAYVFRFPKEDWAIEHLKREARCLELARSYVDMPLPEWTFHEDNFISYPLIPGVALQRHHIFGLGEPGAERVAEQLARFLAQMHTIPEDVLKAADIPPSGTVRSGDDWLRLYDDVQDHLFPHLMEYTQSWIHNHFAPLVHDPAWMDYKPVFMNGDLAPYHLLYDPSRGKLNGIIDFGTAGVGDPAADVACLIDSYGETFVRRIAEYYPGIVELIDRARFWAGTLELQWALKGIQSGDPFWTTAHIGRARDVMPIGSEFDIDRVGSSTA